MTWVRTVRDLVAAEPVDRCRHDGERHLDQRHHPAPGHAALYLEAGETVRLPLEALGQLRRAAHRLAEEDPGDRERLLHERGDVGHRLLPRRRDQPARLADLARDPHEHRQQPERQQRQLPVEQEHRDHGRRDRRDRRHHGCRGRREDVVDAADVVRDPALHLAGAGLREEREREPLQVAVDGRAHVVHHALADLRREVRLDDAERPGDHGDRDRDADEGARQSQPPFGNGGVEERLDDERRDHAEPGRDEDQQRDDGEPAGVRAEEPPDAAQVRAAHSRVLRPDDRLARREGVTGAGHLSTVPGR